LPRTDALLSGDIGERPELSLREPRRGIDENGGKV
jgi:hypothetical protein